MRPKLSLICTLAFLCAVFSVRSEPLAEAPCEYRDGLLWLKVAVEGHREPLHFLLDSGAGATVLNVETAKRLGLRFGRSENVQGVHTLSKAYWTSGFKGEIAGVSLPDTLLAINLAAVSQTCHQQIDGLIGADFFHGRVVQIDFVAGEVRLLSCAEICPNSQILPLKSCNDCMCVPLSIAGESGQLMRVDTGCTEALQWVVTASKAAKLRNTSVALAGNSICYIATEVQIGARRFTAIRTGIHPQEIFSGEGGLLGNGILSKFRVTVDAAKKRLILDEG